MGKVTPPVWSTLLVLPNQQHLRVSPMWWAATHSDVHDGGPGARAESPFTPRTGGCCCNSSCRRAGCTGSGRSARCSSCAAALTRVRKARSRWPGSSPAPGCQRRPGLLWSWGAASSLCWRHTWPVSREGEHTGYGGSSAWSLYPCNGGRWLTLLYRKTPTIAVIMPRTFVRVTGLRSISSEILMTMILLVAFATA